MDRSLYPDLKLLKPRVKISIDGQTIAEIVRVETESGSVTPSPTATPARSSGSREHFAFLLNEEYVNPAEEFTSTLLSAYVGYTYRCKTAAQSSQNLELRSVAPTFKPYMASLGADAKDDLTLLARMFPGRVKNARGQLISEAGKFLTPGDPTATLHYSTSISNVLNSDVNGDPLEMGNIVKFWTGLMPAMVASGQQTSGGRYSCGKWNVGDQDLMATYGIVTVQGQTVISAGSIQCNLMDETKAHVLCVSNPVE